MCQQNFDVAVYISERVIDTIMDRLNGQLKELSEMVGSFITFHHLSPPLHNS